MSYTPTAICKNVVLAAIIGLGRWETVIKDNNKADANKKGYRSKEKKKITHLYIHRYTHIFGNVPWNVVIKLLWQTCNEGRIIYRLTCCLKWHQRKLHNQIQALLKHFHSVFKSSFNFHPFLNDIFIDLYELEMIILNHFAINNQIKFWGFFFPNETHKCFMFQNVSPVCE